MLGYRVVINIDALGVEYKTQILEWTFDFPALNEHGYFGAPIRHYCRLCEALNFNSK